LRVSSHRLLLREVPEPEVASPYRNFDGPERVRDVAHETRALKKNVCGADSRGALAEKVVLTSELAPGELCFEDVSGM